MAKQRFELVEGTSKKFWEIEPQGNDLAIAWGRIGTAGQSQTKSFADPAAAAKAAAKLIKEKTDKGYSEVSGGEAAGAAEAAPKAPAKQPSKEPAPKEPAPKEPAPKEPAPKAAQPEAPAAARPTVGGLPDAIVWPPEAAPLRDELVPTGPPAPLPQGDDAALVEAVRTWLDANPFTNPSSAYEKYRNRKNLAAGRALADTIGLAALDRLIAYAEGKLPTTFAPELDAPVLMLATGHEARSALVGLLLRHTGAQQTFDTLCATYLFDHCSQNGDQEAFPIWVTRLADPATERKGSYGVEPQLASLIAHAGSERAELERRAEALRGGPSVALEVALVLAFDRKDWAAAAARRLMSSGGRIYTGYAVAMMLEDELVPLAKVRVGHHAPYQVDPIATVARLGFRALPYLTHLAAADQADFTRVAHALSVLEHPDAAAALVTFLEKKGYSNAATQKEHAAIVQRYFARRPDLAVRVLGPIAAGRSKLATKVEPILKAALRSDPGLLATAGAALEPRVREHLAGWVETPAESVAAAREDDVPEVLRTPPWTKKTSDVPVLALEVTAPHVPLRPDFTGDETEPSRYYFPPSVAKPDDVKPRTPAFDAFFREKLPSLSPYDMYSMIAALTRGATKSFYETQGTKLYPHPEVFYQRLGNEVWPRVVEDVRDRPAWVMDYTATCAEPRLARPYALALETKSQRARATAWLRSFPEAAAQGLLPVAFGAASKAQVAARRALRLLLSSHEDVVRAVAAGYGPEARKALSAFEASPPDIYPKKLPAMPTWLDLSVLPQLALKKGGALGEAHVRALLVLLALSPLEEPLVALGEVKEALEPRSAARFGWDLFQQWLAAGGNNKESWCFWALGHLGDDDSARRLTPLVRAWPGESAHARAVVGLDVLAAIGTDVALMHLHGIAQKLKFKGLQEKAREKIAQIAEARGLTADELADRLVPDLELDASGSRTLDFGARAFRVSFDEALRPVVLDASGKVLAELPKPGKSDDSAKAKEAVEIWKAIKADAKTIASGQVARLELMMCSERKASADAFRLFFLEHPLLIHVVRRLVWGTYDDQGRLITSFRVSEDRTLADVADAAFTLPEGARVGIVHRLHLTEPLVAKWAGIFADYGIIPPFEQLGRVVLQTTDAEKAGTRVTRDRFEAKTGAVLRLEARGWRKGENEQGCVLSMEKPLAGGIVAELPIDGGIYLGWPEGTPPVQGITYVRLREGDRYRGSELPFSRLGAVATSELLRDLESLRD